jgi:hypothetical protein
MKKQMALAILALCSANAIAQFNLTVVNGYGSGNYPAGSTVHVWSRTTKQTNSVFDVWSSNMPGLNISDTRAWHTDIIMPTQDVTVTASSISLPPTFDINTPNTTRGLKKVVVPGAVVTINAGAQTTTFGTPAYTQMVSTPVGMPLGSTQVTLKDRDVYYYFPQNMKGVIYFFHWTNGAAEGWIESSERFEMVKDMIARGYGVIIPNSEERERKKSGMPNWDIEQDGVARFVHQYQNVQPAMALTPTQLEDYIKHQYDIYALRRIHNYFVNQNKMNDDVCEFGIGFSAGAGFAPVAGYKLGYKAVACIGNAGHGGLFLNASDYIVPTIFSYGVNDGYDPVTQQFEISNKVTTHCNALTARAVPNENHPIQVSPVHPLRFTNIYGMGTALSTNLFNEMLNASMLALNASGQATFNLLATNAINTLTTYPLSYPTWQGLSYDVQNNAENVIYNINAGHSVNSQHDFKIATFFDQFVTCNSGNRITNPKNSVKETMIASVKLYPNPTSENLRVERKDNLPIHYTVFDTNGKLIAKGSLSLNEMTINTSSLAKGIYMINISGDGFEKAEKLVKE